VEDTAANCTVVARALEKRGHVVTHAFNGREALELVRQRKFDVILMDVQMPVMDGFEASMAIRQWEQENKVTQPTPIIAMTAHTMRSECCFAAGMSGYLSKPMDIHLLAQTVENSAKNTNIEGHSMAIESRGGHVGTTANTNHSLHTASGHITGEEGHENIDLQEASRRLRGDRMLLNELISCYRDDHVTLIEQIVDSLENGDAKVAHRAAHTLKGLASNFDAVRTPYFAQQVELACAAGDLDEARRNLPLLTQASAELADLLEAERAANP
jgi:two-component system sensor histidine kinase/response regulator